MEFKHISVLLDETIDALNIKPDGIYCDGTAGGAGHSSEIAKRLSGGMLYAFDRDPDAVKIASERLKGLPATVIHSNFSEMAEKLSQKGGATIIRIYRVRFMTMPSMRRATGKCSIWAGPIIET